MEFQKEKLGARLALRTVHIVQDRALPCRFAGLFSRSPMVEFQDDWETVSPSAGTGTRLLRQELDNHSKGLPPGLTAMPASRGRWVCLSCLPLVTYCLCDLLLTTHWSLGEAAGLTTMSNSRGR